MIDILVEYNRLVSIARESKGWDYILQFFCSLYPEREFYTCSTAWVENNKYVLKLGGVKGDLIVGFYGVHDVNL